MAALIAALGAGSAAVAGHDWGGGLAWSLASRHPSASSGCAPQRPPSGPLPHQPEHRPPVAPHLVHSPSSSPGCPSGWAARDFQALRWVLRHQPTRPGAFTAQDIDRYVVAAARPGALRAAINYYRAAFRANPLTQAHGCVAWISRP